MAEIGILGGTFDPPHKGHLALARAAWRELALEQVLWVLTPAPPHKGHQEVAALEHRLAMVQRILRNEPAFCLSRVDVDRPPPHYAVDTLRLLAQQYPGVGLVYIMGGDSLRDLPLWWQAAEFVSLCRYLAVLPRPGVQVDLPALDCRLPGLAARVHFLEAPLLEISSSEIRRRIRAGESVRGLVPAAVERYIRQHRLYLPPDEQQA